MIDYYRAIERTTTKEFMEELLALYEKHGFAVVPTYSDYVSFHDIMRVVPCEADTFNFVRNTEVLQDPNGKVYKAI